MRFIKSFLNTLFFSVCLAVAFTGGGVANILLFYVGVEVLSLLTGAMGGGVLGANDYVDTVLQTARAFIKDENNRKFELRPNFTNLIDMFLRDREYTMPSLSAIRQAETQATNALYINKKDFVVGTAKSCNKVGGTSGSSTVPLTWQTLCVGIRHSFKCFAGNEVSSARAFANDIYNAEVSLFEQLDQNALDYLEANHSTVNAAGALSAGDIRDVAQADKLFFYNCVSAEMRQNNYAPIYLDGHDTGFTKVQQQYINQGAGNSVNTQFQFGGFDFFPSNLITPPAGYESLHYIVPTGGVAVLDWNDPLNRSNASIGDKRWFTMQSLLRPEFTLDVYRTDDCADTSGDGGGTQDLVTTWEIALNYAFAAQPVPTAGETPIFKYGVTDA